MKTRKRSRGPSCPWFSLEQAVQAIGQIERLYSKNPMTRAEAGSAMGFSENSGYTRRWVSTLSQFGLLEKRGAGNVGVTDLAKRVLFPVSSNEQESAVTEALTRPRVFGDLLKSFSNPELASQEVVFSRLRSGAFTEDSARTAAKVFVDSIKYLATVKEDAQVDRVEEASTEDQRGDPVPEPTSPEFDAREQDGGKAPGGFEELCLARLSPDTSVRILVNGPLGAAEFEVLSKVLDVQRLALIGDSENPRQNVQHSHMRDAE